MAQWRFEAKKYESAQMLLNPFKVSKDEKQRSQTYRLLAQTSYAKGQLQSAAVLWETSVEFGERDLTVIMFLANHWFEKEGFKKCMTFLDMFLMQKENDMAALELAIRCAAKLNDTKKAKQILQIYIEHYGLTDRVSYFIKKLSK